LELFVRPRRAAGEILLVDVEAGGHGGGKEEGTGHGGMDGGNGHGGSGGGAGHGGWAE